MSIDINKRTKGNYFWSGECLMQNNDNGTFSSSHVLDIGKIEPDEQQKKFIVTACNNHDKLIEALKNILKADIGEREKFEISDLSHDEINSAKQLLQSIEKETI